MSTSSPLETLIEAVEAGHNLFISGVGGTGKSYILKKLYEHFKKNKRCILTSTTGISAFNIEGKTLHSFTKIILPSPLPKDMLKWTDMFIKRIAKNKFFLKQYRNVDIVFVDEVSMLGANYLDVMNHVCSVLRGNPTPFGGLQLVFGGDMLQLPPVKDSYPFQSESWSQLQLHFFRLTKAYRFDQQSWVECLQRARLGSLTKDDICALQSRLVSSLEEKEPGAKECRPIFLSSKNAEVDNINGKQLESLHGESVTFHAVDAVEKQKYVLLDMKGLSLQSTAPTVFSPSIEANFIVDKSFTCKIGAQVMLLANLDIEAGLVNGSRGIIIGISDKKANSETTVMVQFDTNLTVSIGYTLFKYEEEDCVYIRNALPLRLAWAVTIHKCQGLTLTESEIDIGDSIFCKGQSYVALSRCKSLQGTFIKSFDQYKMKPDPKALQFEKEFIKSCIDL
jgi:ATP-dependent DNA helicase PIF1